MLRYCIELSYEGTLYHGWQHQLNATTIQQLIEEALSLLLRAPIQILGAGRTDSGVHARQMFAHFDFPASLPSNITERLNRFLPNDIAIIAIALVDNNFHARFDARSRTYEYLIQTTKNPFMEAYSWRITQPLDLALMNEGAELLLTYTDFTSFSKLHSDTKTNICTLHQAQWFYKEPNLLCFEITADRFLRNMVRSIVGTLIDLGKQRIDLSELRMIIETKNRSLAGASAPAKGLYLTQITY